MTDINELIHAIGLAEKLAAGVAREADRFPTEDVTRIREALASARIRAEEVGISADLICDETERDDRLKRAVEAIAASEGKTCVPFRPTGRFVVSDEVGSAEWKDARASGSKVELVRLRQESSDRLADIVEQSPVRPVDIMLEARGEPIEVFATNENIERLRQAIGQI